ncbi:MAG: hypothetical protein KA715_14150 [Xanthomonadaceae bacterium]|nr:hypothetical protein [Xanthomonadaceae bacterium]
MSISSQFIYIGCQLGAEKHLKDEIFENHRELKLSYSQKGLVTFKSEKPLDEYFELNSILARTWGWSLKEPYKTAHGAHQWSPDGEIAESLTTTLLKTGNFVREEIILSPKTTWHGVKKITEFASRRPGGFFPSTLLDPLSPSRAYLKCIESLERFRLEMKPGEHAFEIGSAPGGAAWALLKMGLSVTGVDPGKMEKPVLGHKNFTWIKKSIFQVTPGELKNIDWLFLDKNVEPRESVSAVTETLNFIKSNPPKALMLTLKLNQWDLLFQIPDILKPLEKYGYTGLHRITQLHSNAQECCACLTHKTLGKLLE